MAARKLCPGTCEPEPCCSTATHQVPAAGQPGQFNPTKDDAINTVKYAMSIPVPNHHAPPSTGPTWPTDLLGHLAYLAYLTPIYLTYLAPVYLTV